MYQLVYDEDGEHHTFPIVRDDLSLGRAPKNDVVLTHFTISRLHAKILKDKNSCKIVDQNSRNKIKVNGQTVSESVIHDGDEILLGKFPIHFHEVPDEKATVAPLSKIISSFNLKEDAHTDHGAKILRILSRVAETLIANQPLEKVLQTVMDIVFSYLPANRGFLMLYDSESNKLVPKVVRCRHPSMQTFDIAISRTIADRVGRDRVAILTADAMMDDRFNSEQSIVAHNIRSAMYAPLLNKGRVIGIISVDSEIITGAFTQTDLELFSALSNFSAVAIEQAHLNVKIKEEQLLLTRLERYFSPNVVKQITHTKDSKTEHLDVQEREVTVLFSDIVGFTAMSQKMRPQNVAKLLNEYFTEMLDIIFAYDGTLDKYIGDCIMVVFGAPIDQSDHADRAVKTAIKMRDRLHEFNQGRSDGIQLKAHIGINSGKVMAGDIGSFKRKEYTVIGDAVNIAARLESDVAQANQIIIGPATHDLLKGQYELKSRGQVAVRSIEKPLHLYEVIGMMI